MTNYDAHGTETIRRRSIGIACCACLVFSLLVTPSHAASSPVLQVGLRIGYVPGEGMSLGVLNTWDFYQDRLDAIRDALPRNVFLGISGGVDVVLRSHKSPLFRVAAGPHAGYYVRCPMIQTTAGGGVRMAFSTGERMKWGWGAGVSSLVPPLQPSPDYLDPAPEPQVLAGGFYDFSSFGAGMSQHQVGADMRLAYLPFDSYSQGLGYCGGD